MAYTLEREGDTWVYTWPEFGIGVGLDQLTDRRDGLWCEVTFQQLSAGQSLHIHGPARLNMVSTSGHDSLIKHLAPKTEGVKVPWAEIIEIVCTRTTKEYRQGEPCVVLAEVAVPTGGLPYLIWPLLPENETTVIFGPGGTLKSTLALGAGVAAAKGLALPHTRPAARPVTTLYLDWESNDVEHAERLEFIARGWGIEPPSNLYYRPMHRGVRDDQTRLKELRAQLGADLVIYDSLAGACADDMKEQSVATGTLTAMRSIGGTRLVIGHMTREDVGSRDRPGHVFGSAFFDNYGRSMWEVRTGEDTGSDNDESERIMGLFHRKVNRGRLLKRPLMLGLTWFERERALKFFPAEVSDDLSVAGHATLDFRIREALRRGGRTAMEIAESIGEDDKVKSIDSTLRNMKGVIPITRGSKGSPTVWGLSG